MTRDEIIAACRCRCGCGKGKMESLVVDSLYRMSFVPKADFTVVSGYRCVSHNEVVGGVKGSFHCVGQAVDIEVKDPKVVWEVVRRQSWTGIGFNRWRYCFHLDVGNRVAIWHKVEGEYCYVI